MEESEPSHVQPTPEVPVDSVANDGKAEPMAATGGVTDEQWRSMMDLVMAIYEFREHE